MDRFLDDVDFLREDINGEAPILVGGDGRSGTTLVSVMLDSHPGMAVGPELHFKGPTNLGPYILEGLDLLDRGSPDIKETTFKTDRRWQSARRFIARADRFGVSADELRSLIPIAVDWSSSTLESFEDRALLIALMGRWVGWKSGKQRWGMKIMREIKNPQRYLKTFPDARYIHVVRDPRDVAASQLRDHGSWGYSNVQEAAERWNELVLAVDSWATDNTILIKYEDLVHATASTARRLTDFLEEPWHDSVLNHTRQEHHVTGQESSHPSKDALLKPVNDEAIGRFRSDLSSDEVETIETIAADGMALFGYEKAL